MTGNGRRTTRSGERSSSERLNRHRERSKYGSFIPMFNNGNFKVGFGIVLFLSHYYLANSAAEDRIPRVVTPFPAPKITDLPQVFHCCYFFFLSIFDNLMILAYVKKEEWLGWRCCSLKVSTKRVCIGELIVLRSILEFVPGILLWVFSLPIIIWKHFLILNISLTFFIFLFIFSYYS